MKTVPLAVLAALAVLCGAPATSQVSVKADRIAPRPPLDPPGPSLNRWRVTTIACGDEALAASTIVPIKPEFGWAPAVGDGIVATRATIDFAIDASGRPIDIQRAFATGYTGQSVDLTPALAASRFAAGRARAGCRATFVLDATRIADAAPADLMAASIGASIRPTPAAIDRIKPSGSDCFARAPAPLLRGYPDFKKLTPAAGTQNWSMVQFDIDAQGKPIAIKTAASNGDAALDAASRAAVEKSRFERGTRSGCLYPYWQAAAALAAPVGPPKSSFTVDGATCPREVKWAAKPVLSYPANYRRRGIEGWAVIAFDVAPWGVPGNARVLAAEPSVDFGDAALTVIRSSAMQQSDRGYVGCVERVVYLMHRDGADTPGD